MAVERARYRFTVDEYQQMAQAGIFTEDSPIELIEGEIIEMAALGGKHIRCVTKLNRLLVLAVGSQYFVSPRNSVRLDIRLEPEPDFAILRALPDGAAPPPAADVLLLIEVADTTLLYDLNVKAPLYARTGVPEFSVVNLTAERIIRHAEVQDGHYMHVDEFRRGDHIIARAVAELTVPVTEVFS